MFLRMVGEYRPMRMVISACKQSIHLPMAKSFETFCTRTNLPIYRLVLTFLFILVQMKQNMMVW